MRAVSSAQDPSAAAEHARARLHEEIERVRLGVEEMLAEQGGGGPSIDQSLIDRLRLEGRLEQVEQARRYAEWRIHTNVEAMLDSLLREMRATADRLTAQPLTR